MTKPNESHSRYGEVLGGRYRLISLLGQGGMSRVFLAEDMKLKGKMWAVKEVPLSEREGPAFMEEAAMLAQLQHAQLPQLVDFFISEDDNGCLVMDYIQGPTLQHVFEEAGQRLPINQVVQIAMQLCDIFHYLHTFQPQGIIYRDLKPSNVMLGLHGQVRLIDFGVARQYKPGQFSDTIQMGTLGFAAPEQYLNQQTDERTDLYTLGAMLYYLLSGGCYPALTKTSIRQLQADLPESLISLIDDLLQERPELRCQSAMEVRLRLRPLLPDTTSFTRILYTETKNQSDQLILVGGLFAGSGSTFTAIALARLCHALNLRNAYVEQPTLEPDLYMLLYGDERAPKPYHFPARLVKSSNTAAHTPWVQGHTTWVPSHPDGGEGDWQAADSYKLLHMIKKPVVLWDVSTSWQHPTVQELCYSADHMVVVVDASPSKCNRPSARALLAQFEAYAKQGKQVHAVVNGEITGQGAKDWLSSLPWASVSVLPQISRELISRAVWRGDCVQDLPEVRKLLHQRLSPLLQALFSAEQIANLGDKREGKNWLSWFRRRA
ncbi:serine/threonine protein kinase [Paenibacillus whitsoniae]|uniref:serine/threonine protein kinase n=1 Tax=Paenibacillus whitsoniae TaxID=2496558 RepID=UPI0013DF8B1F|nr:serine/threonine-protein kinase [Paenibacillus whitsoniae]